MLRRIATVVEGAVAVAVVVTVVLLFTNDPEPAASTSGDPTAAVDAYGLPVETGPANGSAPAPTPASVAADGAAVYGARCAGCHGATGGGGIGPALADGRTVEVYPDPADQVAVVAGGRGGMPAFSGRLTDAEIAAVVDFVRNDLVSS